MMAKPRIVHLYEILFGLQGFLHLQSKRCFIILRQCAFGECNQVNTKYEKLVTTTCWITCCAGLHWPNTWNPFVWMKPSMNIVFPRLLDPGISKMVGFLGCASFVQKAKEFGWCYGWPLNHRVSCSIAKMFLVFFFHLESFQVGVCAPFCSIPYSSTSFHVHEMHDFLICE